MGAADLPRDMSFIGPETAFCIAAFYGRENKEDTKIRYEVLDNFWVRVLKRIYLHSVTFEVLSASVMNTQAPPLHPLSVLSSNFSPLCLYTTSRFIHSLSCTAFTTKRIT